MFEQLAQIERRLDTFTFEIYGFGPRLDDLNDRLSTSPTAVGFRSIRSEIADLRWRFVTLPRNARRLALVLNMCVVLGTIGLGFV